MRFLKKKWTGGSGCGKSDDQLNVKQIALESYRDTFQHAIEGRFRTTIEGRWIEVNQALAQICGCDSPEELVSHLTDLNTQFYIEPGRRAGFVRTMRQEGRVSDFKSEVRRRDGKTVWIAEFARVVADENGAPLYFEGSVIDISAHKRAELALRKHERELRLLVETTNVVPWEADARTGRYFYVGPQAVPCILRELEHDIDHWFWALVAITGEDVAVGASSLDEAATLWVKWARSNGIL